MATQSSYVVTKFILRESQGVILLLSTFSVNFSVNQFKLFSFFFFIIIIFNLSSCSKFLWVIANSNLHNHADFEEVVNYRDVYQ